MGNHPKVLKGLSSPEILEEANTHEVLFAPNTPPYNHYI